ncbi:MAG: hypothetical protein GXP54_06325 [Deltaproteobacteria bacterium]|nr:hypothetical protein [Deltaproteobacteria bacterium]
MKINLERPIETDFRFAESPFSAILTNHRRTLFDALDCGIKKLLAGSRVPFDLAQILNYLVFTL